MEGGAELFWVLVDDRTLSVLLGEELANELMEEEVEGVVEEVGGAASALALRLLWNDLDGGAPRVFIWMEARGMMRGTSGLVQQVSRVAVWK